MGLGKVLALPCEDNRMAAAEARRHTHGLLSVSMGTDKS